MILFTANQIKSLDEFTIKHEPISSIDLMERAAHKLFKVFKSKYKRNKPIVVIAGPGNNGGDGLALARMLLNDDYNVTVYLIAKPDKLSPDSKANYERLSSIGSTPIILSPNKIPTWESGVIVDAIFGTGLSRPAEGIYKEIIQHINASSCDRFSIDIPSGLFSESNHNNDPDSIVKAQITVSFQIPKMAFLFPENEKYTGKIIIENIGLLIQGIETIDSPFQLITQQDVCTILKERPKFSHKGHFGHALLVAGNYGKMGAAILAAKACMKSGVGLLTCHVPHCAYPIIQTAIPEAMASMDRSDFLISEVPELSPFNVIGIGPGLGTKSNTILMIQELLKKNTKPTVIDADALNILAMDKTLLESLPENTILTPHPGEYKRLFGIFNDGYERLKNQIEMSKKYHCTIVLKGAHTATTTPDGHCFFNTNGNPGMATAGSGDVLTGIITGLLAQGYTPEDASCLGVWLHGKAADIFAEKSSMEALTASDIISHLGDAFKECHPTVNKAFYF